MSENKKIKQFVMPSTTGNDDIRALAKHGKKLLGDVDGQYRSFKSYTDAMKKVGNLSSEQRIRNRLKEIGVISNSIGDSLGFKPVVKPINPLAESVMGGVKIGSLIAGQRKRLDDIAKVGKVIDLPECGKLMPPIVPMPNPVIETNKRLKRLEGLFERMLEFEKQSAIITTDLQEETSKIQTKAEIFLGKFEMATVSSAKSTRQALTVAGVALFLSFVQVVYGQFMGPSQQEKTLRLVIAEMKVEISTLKTSQIEASGIIANALEKTGDENTLLLKDIRNALVSGNEATEIPVPRKKP